MYISIKEQQPEYGIQVIVRTTYGMTLARRICSPPFFVNYKEEPVLGVIEWKYLNDN